MRKKRGVGRDDDDDGAAALMIAHSFVTAAAATAGRALRDASSPRPRQRLVEHGADTEVGDLGADRDAEDLEVATVVALHQDAEGLAALFLGQHPRRGADAALE